MHVCICSLTRHGLYSLVIRTRICSYFSMYRILWVCLQLMSLSLTVLGVCYLMCASECAHSCSAICQCQLPVPSASASASASASCHKQHHASLRALSLPYFIIFHFPLSMTSNLCVKLPELQPCPEKQGLTIRGSVYEA